MGEDSAPPNSLLLFSIKARIYSLGTPAATRSSLMASNDRPSPSSVACLPVNVCHDWDVLTSPKPPENANPAPFANWIKGESKVEPVPLDKDVFGDGSVIMLYTPGHTPGHHSLLVKLPQMGNVLLSGDLMHFRENYDTNGVPAFNTDRSQTLASLDRVKKIVAGSKATVIVQHDARDLDKLPAFPAAAK
jgi:N-acyl homoserine lactone hydrolase